MKHQLRSSLWLACPRAKVFAFFADAHNLERITPPELHFQILSAPDRMQAGSLIDYSLGLFGVRFLWRTEIMDWDPPHCFVDRQLRGPYAQWVHRHTFIERNGGTQIDDLVDYRLPLSPIGDLAWPLVRLQLMRIFRYRSQHIRRLLRG